MSDERQSLENKNKKFNNIFIKLTFKDNTFNCLAVFKSVLQKPVLNPVKSRYLKSLRDMQEKSEIQGDSRKEWSVSSAAVYRYMHDVAQYGLAPNVITLTLYNIILAARQEQTAKVC